MTEGTPTGGRGVLIARLARFLNALACDGPLRVGIDGRSAAGKTTLADELSTSIQALGRPTVRASIDDFHKPGHAGRSRREEWTPETYYEDGYDYQAFRDLVLRPLGPGGSRRCRMALLDSFHDRWMPERWTRVDDRTVALVDGAFLCRPDLINYWDFLVWVEIDFETMVQRARVRDTVWVGSADVVEKRYRSRWIPTHLLYERLTDAPSHADAVIDNRDLDRPRLVRLPRRPSNDREKHPPSSNP